MVSQDLNSMVGTQIYKGVAMRRGTGQVLRLGNLTALSLASHQTKPLKFDEAFRLPEPSRSPRPGSTSDLGETVPVPDGGPQRSKFPSSCADPDLTGAQRQTDKYRRLGRRKVECADGEKSKFENDPVISAADGVCWILRSTGRAKNVACDNEKEMECLLTHRSIFGAASKADGRLDVSGSSCQEVAVYFLPTPCMKRKFLNRQAAIESS
jgi:hypothetical protein